jgi:hypothetical protein
MRKGGLAAGLLFYAADELYLWKSCVSLRQPNIENKANSAAYVFSTAKTTARK